jgi:phasin family protein
MVAEVNTPSEAVVEAVIENNEAAAETVRAVAEKGARKAKKAARKARRNAKAAAPNAEARANERNDTMTFDPTNIFAGFTALPGASAFESFFNEAASRGEEAVKRSRKAAEELADMYRGNVDAFVEAGRIAATGAQSIGQDIAAKSRETIEQSANSVRAFAEAKSPTELLQLHGEFARTAFDRFVEDSSALTESFVKLAGEAFQPISNRASANVERLNEIAA